jgi:hypothetical protein
MSLDKCQLRVPSTRRAAERSEAVAAQRVDAQRGNLMATTKQGVSLCGARPAKALFAVFRWRFAAWRIARSANVRSLAREWSKREKMCLRHIEGADFLGSIAASRGGIPRDADAISQRLATDRSKTRKGPCAERQLEVYQTRSTRLWHDPLGRRSPRPPREARKPKEAWFELWFSSRSSPGAASQSASPGNASPVSAALLKRRA